MYYTDKEAARTAASDLFDPCEISLDKKLFKEIYECYWHRLYYITLGRLQDKEAAEEIVQDIFTSLWERKNLSGIRNMESYLLTATRFAIIDYIRQKVARKKFLEYSHSFLKIQSVNQHALDSHELPELIEEGLSPLSETTKDIFRLSYFQNWKKGTIARHFHLSEKAIEYHLTKSQKTIRFYLENAAL